jgi:hypothetical protein
MASEFFSSFLEFYDFWVWIIFWIAIFISVAWSKGMQRLYSAVVILGFLLAIKFIDNFFVSIAFIAAWLVFVGINFFFSKELLLLLLASLIFLGLSNPFFYVIVFVVYILIVWNFLASCFCMLDTQEKTG